MQQAICVISQKSNMEVVFQISERVKNSLRLGNYFGDAISADKHIGLSVIIINGIQRNAQHILRPVRHQTQSRGCGGTGDVGD